MGPIGRVRDVVRLGECLGCPFNQSSWTHNCRAEKLNDGNIRLTHPEHYSRVCVFVEGVGDAYSKIWYLEVCEEFGDVVAAHFFLSREGRYHQGSGLVQLRNPDACSRALQALSLSAGGNQIPTNEPGLDARRRPKKRHFRLSPTHSEFDITTLLIESFNGPTNWRSPRVAIEMNQDARQAVMHSTENGWAILAGTWPVG